MGTTYSTYDLLRLLRISIAQWTRSSELFFLWTNGLGPTSGQHCWCTIIDCRLPAPFFESQIAPLKSSFSLRMENGASLANRHKSQSPQDQGNGYNIQNLRLHAAFVYKFRVTFIQPSCHYSFSGAICDSKKGTGDCNRWWCINSTALKWATSQ